MKYYVFKCKINLDDLVEENYGVMLQNDDNSREYACDVSKNVNSITILVDKMNEFRIAPCHMQSVIEDFQYEETVSGHT